MCEEKKFEGIVGKVEVKCEGCTDLGEKAEAFCHQCINLICKECVESHKVMKLFSSHEVASLEDLTQRQAREIAVNEPFTKRCPVHEKPQEDYCFDCDFPICHDCAESDHKYHDFKSSKIAAPDIKKSVLEKLGPLKEVATNMTKAIQDVQTIKQEIEAKEKFVADSIQTSFDELKKTGQT